MPSVMATMTAMPASAASMMASAAAGGGTKIMVALAPVLRTASATVLNSGKPSLHGAALAGRDAADDLRAVFAALHGVEGAGFAHALTEDAGVFIDEDAHCGLPFCWERRISSINVTVFRLFQRFR